MQSRLTLITISKQKTEIKEGLIRGEKWMESGSNWEGGLAFRNVNGDVHVVSRMDRAGATN